MLYQQLRILPFIVVALARLSTAATFTCDNEPGYLECTIDLNPGGDFLIAEGGGWGCTDNGDYCAEVESASDEEWKFIVTNYAATCTASCLLL